MSIAYIDRTQELHCEERGGVIRSLTRMATVIGLEDDIDYNVLWSALEAAGIPTVPTPLPGTGFEALQLDDRTARLLHDDKGTCEVLLTYRHVLDGTQELTPDSDPTTRALNPNLIYGKMRASIQQVPTNFTFNFDTLELEAITVSHTFPDGTDAFKDADGNTLPKDPDYPGQTFTQGGEIEGTIPMRNFECEGYWDTDDPDGVVDGIISHVNSNPWRGQGAREWLCTEARNEGIVTLGRYKFHFEFQHNPFGWDPFTVFIDARTGRPPVALVPGVGYKQIEYVLDVDFNDYFAAFFD